MVKISYGVVLDPSEHSPSIGRDDSSDTLAWRPFCSCGWSGIAIFSLVEIKDLQAIFQKFAEQHGIGSILPADSIFGEENDALIQVLQHIGYDPENDKRISEEELDSAVQSLKNFRITKDGFHAIYDLTSDFPRITDNVADQKHRSFVWDTVDTPILRENAIELEIALRQYMIDAWESRNSDSGDFDDA